MDKQLSRREFLQASSAAAMATAVPFSAGPQVAAAASSSFRGVLCLFSKGVPQMSWRELAQSAKSAGFGGIDLTVRDGGHVLPERVREDLPKAVEVIRGEGLEVPMITTELHAADDPAAVPILSTAGKLSIPFLKPGYYEYKFADVRKELEEAGNRFRGLVGVAEKFGVQVGFHNHAGFIGAPVWDIARIMDTLDPKWAGYYFDLQHATAEGGVAGWKIAALLTMRRIKMLAVKDMYWKKAAAKGWSENDCSLGQGMCHFKDFLKMVAQGGFHGPISLHLEYEIPGVSDHEGIALSRAKDSEVMAAAKRDLDYLKSLLHQAYEVA
jgi:sugar phosphate isomerase/epimerase